LKIHILEAYHTALLLEINYFGKKVQDIDLKFSKGCLQAKDGSSEMSRCIAASDRSLPHCLLDLVLSWLTFVQAELTLAKIDKLILTQQQSTSEKFIDFKF